MTNINNTVAVYGVCKNEEKNIIEWYESVKDADYIFLLDTGSTDNTVNIAKNLGINVLECVIDPWDETLAKNIAIAFIPKDIVYCLVLDLDRRIITVDWVKKIKDLTGAYGSIHVNVLDIAPYSNDDFIKHKHPIIHSRFGSQWISYRPHLFTCDNNNIYLNIDVLNVPGDLDRYQNREPLYQDTYKFFCLKDKINHHYSLNLLCNYALSAFENNDLSLADCLFWDIIEQIKNNNSNQYVSPVLITSLFFAQSLSFPEKTEYFLFLGTKTNLCVEKKVFWLRFAIFNYYKNNISLCKHYLKMFKNESSKFHEEFKFCENSSMIIFNLLEKFCNNELLNNTEKEKIFKYFSYVLIGKERPELVQNIIKYLNVV